MQNFTDIARQFIEKNGAVQVRDAAMLEKVLGELLEDKYQRAELGRNALLVVSENIGATGQDGGNDPRKAKEPRKFTSCRP